MREKYQKLQALRKKVKSNKNYMDKYQELKKLNKNDEMYGWRFENEGAVKGEIPSQDNHVHDLAAGACLRDRRQSYCHARIFPRIRPGDRIRPARHPHGAEHAELLVPFQQNLLVGGVMNIWIVHLLLNPVHRPALHVI